MNRPTAGAPRDGRLNDDTGSALMRSAQAEEKRGKVIFFTTEDWYFVSHRLALGRALVERGYDVAVITRVRAHGPTIRQAGIALIPINLSRRSVNPLRAMLVIARLVSLYRRERPDIVHHVAIKPVLLGSIAALFARVPWVVNALAGLGYIFISSQGKARVLRPLVRLAFRTLLQRDNTRVIVQNRDDQHSLVASGMIKPDSTRLIRGSGVDTEVFRPAGDSGGEPLVVLVSRMLWDKGVGEFVRAAELLRLEGVRARFALVGDEDSENHASVPRTQLEAWRDSGTVEWWGHRNDIQEVFASASIVCLPSYREGLPKVLIEAAACAKPIVTTDVPGCREVVRDQVNGLLVAPRSAEALVHPLRRLIEDPDLRREMGRRGREIAQRCFDVATVVRETLAVYRELLHERPLA